MLYKHWYAKKRLSCRGERALNTVHANLTISFYILDSPLVLPLYSKLSYESRVLASVRQHPTQVSSSTLRLQLLDPSTLQYS